MSNYVVYDVFTDQPFGGNQLAVFPDAMGIPEDTLQRIAAEFNFSEVTFVYPAENDDHTAKVRIFTPTMEIPFAGHPTIGTAIALRDLGHKGNMILELGVGPIPCAISERGAAFTTTVPLEIAANPDPDLVAQALGLNTDDINFDTHVPIQAGVGLTFAIVELNKREALSKCSPVIDVVRNGAELYPTGLDFALFAYVRDGDTIDARMFAPLDNMPEDPATGSACAALTALLHEKRGGNQNLKITQGEDMGRLSIITASSVGNPVAVTIAGNAVKTMEGTFHISD